jgi:hypothetical protein
MRFSIFINNQQVNLSAGDSTFLPNMLEYTTDENDTFTFSETHICPPGSYAFGMPVTIKLDSAANPCFVGKIVDISYDYSEDVQWTISYTAMGLKYWVNLIPVISSYDTPDYTFNLRSDDPNYNPSFSGLQVGQMFKIVLDNHMSKLNAAGIYGYIQADLDAMTIVPPDVINIGGPRLLDALQGVLGSWQCRYCIRVQYDTTTGRNYLRFENAFNYGVTTLAFGVDPIDPTQFTCKPDSSNCYGRVEYRGYSKAEAAILSVKEGTLTPTWTTTAQNNWNWNQFANPAGMVSVGSVSSLSTVDCVCTSDNTQESWTANQWNTNKAWIYLQYSSGSGSGSITFAESRRLNANNALSKGGSALVSWNGDIPIVGSSYNRYKIVGTQGTTANVWREYSIANSYVASHLMNSFPQPIPWAVATTMQLIKYPASLIFWTNGSTGGYSEYNTACGPALFEVDKVNGIIRFREPTVKPFNTQDNLNKGGSNVTPPYDVRVVVPYSLGSLTASYPADTSGTQNYNGTFYTATGIARTLTFNDDNWVDPRQASQYQAVCQMLQECYKDVKYNGSVTYLGLYTPAIQPRLGLNFSVNEFAGASQDLGLTAINCPVRVTRIVWNSSPNSDNFTTIMDFNNVKQPATGTSYYVHPAFAAVQAGLTATSIEQALSSNNGYGSTLGMDGEFEGLGVEGMNFGGPSGGLGFGFGVPNGFDGPTAEQNGILNDIFSNDAAGLPMRGQQRGQPLGAANPAAAIQGLGTALQGLAGLGEAQAANPADAIPGLGTAVNGLASLGGNQGQPSANPQQAAQSQPQGSSEFVGPPRIGKGPNGEYAVTPPLKAPSIPQFVGPPAPIEDGPKRPNAAESFVAQRQKAANPEGAPAGKDFIGPKDTRSYAQKMIDKKASQEPTLYPTGGKSQDSSNFVGPRDQRSYAQQLQDRKSNEQAEPSSSVSDSPTGDPYDQRSYAEKMRSRKESPDDGEWNDKGRKAARKMIAGNEQGPPQDTSILEGVLSGPRPLSRNEQEAQKPVDSRLPKKPKKYFDRKAKPDYVLDGPDMPQGVSRAFPNLIDD